jgi:hypothetical protein
MRNDVRNHLAFLDDTRMVNRIIRYPSSILIANEMAYRDGTRVDFESFIKQLAIPTLCILVTNG